MRPEAKVDIAVFDGLGQAIRARAPVHTIEGVRGCGERIAAGIAVYRNNVRAAHLRALGDTFPVVRRLVGEAFFRYLAHEYFHARPPSSRLLRCYGNALPEFLGSFDSRLPYLADVARLELAWLEAYHAAEAPVMSPAGIFSALGDAYDDAMFVLHPSVRLLVSIYPVHTIWLHNRARQTEVIDLSNAEGERVLLVRPQATVLTQAIPAAAWTALSAIRRGARLKPALDEAMAADPQASLESTIASLATSGVIRSVAAEEDAGRARQ